MHYTWGSGQGGDALWLQVAAHGFGGVIIFLVLSGYILAYTYNAEFRDNVGRQAYGTYLYKRLARIYPLHILTIAAFIALVALGIPLRSENETLFTLLLNLLLIQAWGFVNLFTWNTLSWTISVEFFAYLWLPFFLWAISRVPALAAALLIAALILFVKQGYYYSIAAALGANLATLQLAWGHYLVIFSAVIGSGAALHRLCGSYESSPWISSLLVVAGLGVIAYASMVPFENWLVMCGALVLIAGLKEGNGLGKAIFGNAVSVFLGNISYALYLTHSLLNITIRHFDPESPLWLRLMLALLLASVVYYFFEKPTQKFLRSFLPNRR